MYQAYMKTGDKKYRIGAEWSMEFLNSLSLNPAYELQLVYGTYTAARMNAEIGTAYDLQKMFNWCFDVGPLRSWGATLGKWGNYDAYGLIGATDRLGYPSQVDLISPSAVTVHGLVGLEIHTRRVRVVIQSAVAPGELAVNLGVRIALGKRAAVAMVYRGEFKLRLDLSATLHGDVSGLTTAYYALETHSVNNFLPQQAVLGGSWELFRDVKANLDVTWVNWAAYVPPVASLNVKLDIPPPKGGWPAGITPPTAPAPARIARLSMHDRVVPHLGVEWRVVARAAVEGFVRAGYEYAKSPIAPQTGSTNYIDRDRHAMSAGVGARVMRPIAELPGDVRLDLHTQLIELVTATTRKGDPADVVGDYVASGHIWNVGATLTVGF